MDNKCVCCGAVIPEGRMVCPICEAPVPPKLCKYCRHHYGNACLINIGLWKDDDYCSQWKEKKSNESNKN